MTERASRETVPAAADPERPSTIKPAPIPEPAAREPTTSGLLRLYPSLRVPALRVLWLGMLPSTLAWQMSVVATGYAALVLSGSATSLGLVSGVIGLPMLLFSLVGGVAADRFPRRTLLILSQSALGLGAAALAILSLGGVLQVWHLVALGLVQGTAFSFNMPARQAYIAELVPRSLIGNAVSLNNAGMNVCRVAGPSLAGVLLAIPAIGLGGVFLAMALMYAVVVASLVRLPVRAAQAEAAGTRRGAGSWDQLVEGLLYVRSSPSLVALLGLALATLFLAMPYQQLMPLFSERVFGVGAAGLGLLMTANGIGSVAGALFVAAMASFSRQATLLLGIGIGFGLTLVGFALSPIYPLAVFMLLLVGFCWAAYTALNSTLIMSNADPRFYGRVMSVYLLTFAVTPLGALPMSWISDHIGAPLTIAAAGALVALIVAGVAGLFPAYRRIR